MDPKKLSDEDLIERSLYRGYERLVQGDVGCLVAIILGTIAGIAGMTAFGILIGFPWAFKPWWVEWLLYIVFGIVGLPVCLICAALIGASMDGFIVGLRVNKYHTELERRFFPPDTDRLRKRTAEIASVLDEGDWVIACVGKDRFVSWFTAIATCEEGAVTLEAWTKSSDLRLGLCDPRPYTSRVRVTLRSEEVEPLGQALKQLDIEGPFEPLPDVHWTDTMPCTLFVQGPKHSGVQELAFDSASYREQPIPPAPVQLAVALGRLSERQLPPHKDFERDYPFFTGRLAAKPQNVAGGS